MNKTITFIVTLTVIWVGSVLVIMAPSFGLAPTVFPRPDPDYALYLMIASGASLVLASMKTGIEYLKP